MQFEDDMSILLRFMVFWTRSEGVVGSSNQSMNTQGSCCCRLCPVAAALAAAVAYRLAPRHAPCPEGFRAIDSTTNAGSVDN
jgi:hypothetical protein